DSKGIIYEGREHLNSAKQEILKYSNPEHKTGTLKDAIVDADVFIGVSKANLLTADDIRTMSKDPIIFALANPVPEIMPEEALKGGAAVVGTGRSDLPNQVNNVLGFPGIFRGALDARAKRITPTMKLAAAFAIADCVPSPTKDRVIPATLNEEVAWKVATAVREAALQEMAADKNASV
ncbi:MAG: malic enzyme-like NAD(P)-binding protein, partial [Bacteroidota bacterium]